MMFPVNAKPISAAAETRSSAQGSAGISLSDLDARREAWAKEQAAVGTLPAPTNNNSGLKWRAAGTRPNVPQEAPSTGTTVTAATLTLSAPANAVCTGDGPGCSVPPEESSTANQSLRLVSDEQEIDPFNDPFGDRQVQRTVRVAQRGGGQFQPADPLQGPSVGPEVGPTPAPMPMATPEPDSFPSEGNLPQPDVLPTPDPRMNQPTPATPLEGEPTPAQPMPRSFDDPADRPLELQPSQSDRPRRAVDGLIPRSNNLRGPNGEYSQRADGECDRRYNERDCCETDEQCRRARQFILDSDIRKISIDITPRFKPDAPSWNEDYESRDETLKKSDSRQWIDRNGQVLVQGRLIDLAHGKAVILSDSGTIEHLSMNVLAEDELCFINAWWSLPSECVAGGVPFTPRRWEPSTFTFAASGLCHKPLYFEEVQAERYGHVAGPFLQPVISGAHFFLNVAVLPYNMGIHPPTECQYALGYYRPGSCAPWMIPPIPLSVRGGLAEAGIIVGGVFLLP